MESETNLIEYKQTESETDLETQAKINKKREEVKRTGEIRFFGVRVLVTNLVPAACEKIDRIFGSGGEAIIHHMQFEAGQSLFNEMIKCNPSKSLEELLKSLMGVMPFAGWGSLVMRIIRADPPLVEILVKNPPVKTVKGSQKHLIGSFWAGVLSRYFNRQLACKNFSYDAEKDEFSCTITI